MIWTLGLYVAGIGSVLAMIWRTSQP